MPASPRHRSTPSLLLLLVAAAASPASAQSTPEDVTPRDFLTRLQELRTATARTAPAAGLTLERDAGSMAFDDGTVTLLEMDGRVVGAVVDGRGRFVIRPPDPVERWQLEQVFDDPEPTLELEGAVFLFTDGTLAEMEAGLHFAEGPLPEGVRDLLGDGIKFLLHDASVDAEVVRTFLNGEDDGFFHAHLEVDGGDPHYFRIAGYDAEEVSFGREADGRGDYYEILASFHQAADYPDPDPREHVPPGAEVLRYELESRLESGLDFSGRAHLFLSTGLSEGDWVPFRLSSRLRIRAAVWGDGSPVTLERRNGGSQFWVRLPADPSFVEMVVEYDGKVLDYRDRFYWFSDPTGWYPATGRTDATFDMVFHVADDYAFVASGSRVEFGEEEGDMMRSRWVLDSPVSQASFNVGDFAEHVFENDDLPPIRIQLNADLHRDLRASMQILQAKDPEEGVAVDLANSLRFFQRVYGPLDLTEFNVSEIPYLHGQAFPGLIHLSVVTFIQTREGGFDETFRAHEVAHQWWGFSVQPWSYRDRWLSEGLAEFSGLWYMQVARYDPTLYLRTLDDSRKDILDRRGRAGPISLGSRVRVVGRSEDYGTIVYRKGAWVIHMLRNLFIDFDTMEETRFMNLLRDVATRFRGQRISTADFQAVVEEHMGGVDMQWFFDQWVHGTDVPTYRWATRGEEVEGGYKMSLRVRQEDVPEDFRMVVPVTLDFGEEGSATVRVLVTGAVTEVDLPLLPREPDEILFNDYSSVLAEVDHEGW